MRNFIIGLIIGAGLMFMTNLYANDGDRSVEHIFNRIFNSSNNTLRIQ